MMQNIPHICRQSFYRAGLACLLAIAPFGNMSYANAFKLEFPVACLHNQNCWILNYMDMNAATGEAADFTCGPRTEDGYDGIDIAVRDIATAGSGVAVLAAADGTVSEAMDGITDLALTENNVGQVAQHSCGNTVIIDHANGWQTRYCHLREKSVQVVPGQRVFAGQIIGAVGLSGLTVWPKLNFSVARWGTPYDPFTGRTALEGCGLTAQSLWKFPRDIPYRAFAIYNLGFNVRPPKETSIDRGIQPIATLSSNSPSLSFWASIFDANKGDIVDMYVIDPRGNDIMRISTTLKESQKKRLLSLTKPREGVWRAGLYIGTIRITRKDGGTPQISEWQAKIRIVND